MEYVRDSRSFSAEPRRLRRRQSRRQRDCVGGRRRRAARVGAAVPARARRATSSYWIIEGELTVVLDGVEHVAGPSSLVYIPAGVVHKNRNDGAVPELHLDLLVPAPNRFKPGSTPASDDDRGPGTGWVRTLDDVAYESSHVPGFELARLASADSGCSSIIVNAARRLARVAGNVVAHPRVRPAVLGARGHAPRRSCGPACTMSSPATSSCFPPACHTATGTRVPGSSATSRSWCQPRPTDRSTSR